jgi:hypothetical protein
MVRLLESETHLSHYNSKLLLRVVFPSSSSLNMSYSERMIKAESVEKSSLSS